MSTHSAMPSNRRGAPALVLIATLALLAPCAAQATPYVVHLVEQGGNVVATGSGAIDLTGLSLSKQGSSNVGSIGPSQPRVWLGGGGGVTLYAGYLPPVTGPSSFGTGGYTGASSSSGTLIDFDSLSWGAVLAVQFGYVSDTQMSGSATWDNATFASLGITPGSYHWSWGNGPDQSFMLDIVAPNVPEPESLGLFGLGLLMLGGFATLRRRASPQS